MTIPFGGNKLSHLSWNFSLSTDPCSDNQHPIVVNSVWKSDIKFYSLWIDKLSSWTWKWIFIPTFWTFWRQILNKFCPWSFSNWFVAVLLGISSFILTLRNTEQRWLNTCWNVTERQDFVCWLFLIVPGYRSCVKVYSVIVVTLNISHFTKRLEAKIVTGISRVLLQHKQ